MGLSDVWGRAPPPGLSLSLSLSRLCVALRTGPSVAISVKREANPKMKPTETGTASEARGARALI